MASGGSGGGPPEAPLSIGLPHWMKRKTPDRYAFDETPFSPPSPSDEYFLIKFPQVTREAEKRSSYDTINSLIGFGRSANSNEKEIGSADALYGALTSGSSNGTNSNASSGANFAANEERKVRRNSAVTVLPGGQVSIKTYGDPPYKKSSDPGTCYGDYTNRHANAMSKSDQEMPLAPGELAALAAMSLADDAAYDSDCSVSSVASVHNLHHMQQQHQQPSHHHHQSNSMQQQQQHSGITSTILGAIGHHLSDLTTGGHGIMDYFHNQDHEDHELTPPPPPTGPMGFSTESSPPPQNPSAVERTRRIGLGAAYQPPHNPFFTEGSTMSLFSGLYSHDNKTDSTNSGTVAKVDRTDKSLLPSSGVGSLVSQGSFATNRSSSAYDSQLVPGTAAAADVEMESLAKLNKEQVRWVPKPSRKRELNLFAPCSS